MALRSSSALSRSLVRQQGARLRAAPRRQLSGDAKSEGAAGWYERMLESHPMPTKAASSALIAASGDAICQIGVEDHPFDFERFGRFVVLGGALVGPTLHFWYGKLFSTITGTTVAATVQRVAADQLLFAPIFNPIFIGSLAVLEGSTATLGERLRAQYVDIMVGNWVIWGPAQFVNFMFIPQQYAVLFSNCIGMVWNVFLSYTANGGGKTVEDEKKKE